MIKMNNIFFIMVFSLGALAYSAQAQVTKDNLDQNADQSQGNYAATNLNYLGGVGSLGMMQSAWKDPLQHMGEGQTRPGYTKYYWTPELVLPVRVREGMYTLINFPNWEVIENVYIGDGLSFNAEIQGPSSLLVYPDSSQFVGVDTNMIVFGRSGNKYVFYVQSETVNTDRITNAIIDIEVVKKKQGANAGSGSGYGGGYSGSGEGSPDGNSEDSTYTRNLQKEDWIEKIPVDPTKFRFDIEVYVPNPDDIIIAPERVWRDNIFTYIDLGEKALTAVQRPIVTLIVERSETPVGFRTAGPNNRLIIVEGMGDMVLRSGKRIVCLKLRRADSDGLENTVYAKTNEWDLQNAYASQPGNTNAENYEDVYGSTGNGAATGTGGSSGMGSSQSQAGAGFFGNNTFSNAQKGSSSEENSGLSYEDIISGKQAPVQNYQGNSGTGNKKNTFPAGNGNTAQPEQTGMQNGGNTQKGGNILDSLPKVQPVVAPENQEPAPSEQLTGQYDIKANGAELVTPQYNNNAGEVSITRQTDKTQSAENVNANKNTGANPPVLGNSANNSSPVLITPKEDIKGTNTVMSAEMEALLKEFRDGKAFDRNDESNISIELGTDEDVNNLEKLWNDISKNYSATVGKYQPFYSVDTPADGQGKEVFHLRVGPVKSLEEGDNICSQLGRNGIFCSVVRIQ